LKQVSAKIISQEPVMPGVSLAWLESPEITQLATPGQFVMIKCGDEFLLRRPFSIYRTDGNKRQFAILYARVGKGTTWLSEQRANNVVDVLGPLGNGFTVYPKSHHLLLIAGGMGIAPLNFLAIEAQKKGYSVTLKQGANTIARVIKEEHKPAMVTFIQVTEDGSAGEKGLVIDGLSELLNQSDQVFACGPVGMYQTMARMPELKNRSVQVSLEVMMGCGRGVCYGCTLKTKQGLKLCCQDGPVFDLDDIIWDGLD